ncbi:COMM domain-containing protein 3 [Linepithema humile]|uniref:COMM domain-containing protein 3 n=1 Tax=Linepithema humile TaxID=83485 RepID=UPI000623A6AB|nr:PREDICTED: COMM domain-containing protein 3-like [Linepithema humile]
MELAKEVISGLADVQNSNTISEETFVQLLNIILSHIRNNNNDAKNIAVVYSFKSDLVKAAVANISCLFIEAARYDYDEKSLKIFLHNEHIKGQRVEKLCNTYMNNKQDIQTWLELMGDNVPHIVDIDWRLHHCVKASICRSISIPACNIQICIRKCNDIKRVTFTCTIQQLQELVYKLKDIVRHLEKMSNI